MQSKKFSFTVGLAQRQAFRAARRLEPRHIVSKIQNTGFRLKVGNFGDWELEGLIGANGIRLPSIDWLVCVARTYVM